MPPMLFLKGFSPDVDNIESNKNGNEDGAVMSRLVQSYKCSSHLASFLPIRDTLRDFHTVETVLEFKCGFCQNIQHFSLEMCSSVSLESPPKSTTTSVSSFSKVNTSTIRGRGVELQTTYKCKSCSEPVQFTFNFGDVTGGQERSSLINITKSEPYKSSTAGSSVLEAKIDHFCGKCRNICHLVMTFSEHQREEQPPQSVNSDDFPLLTGAREPDKSSQNNDEVPAVLKSEPCYADFKIDTESVDAGQLQTNNRQGGTMKHRSPKKMRKLQCGVCFQSFATQENLNRHTRWACNPGKACKFCQRTYHSSQRRRCHERQSHATELAKYLGATAVVCPGCSAHFESKEGLKGHESGGCPKANVKR